MPQVSSAEPSASSSATPLSSLVPLLALGIVYRYRPDWLKTSLGDAARNTGVSAQRLSHLTTRILPPFETLVSTRTRRGRPATSDAADKMQTDFSITRTLLKVSTALLAYLPQRKREVRDLVVGAYLRLRDSHPSLTQARFCKALHLSPRTLRSWLHAPRRPPVDSKPQPKRKKNATRKPRRNRFDFDVILPDTQFAADTTHFKVLGVSLKLVAAQDVGGRDQELLDSVIIDEHENAQHVLEALQGILGDYPGAQLLTDQGTPYMAKEVRQALEAFNVEHAPKIEGEPTGKATIERAFRTIKDIAKPILQVSNDIAVRFPQARNVKLALPAAKILITALLKAYQAGGRSARRADQQRQGISRQELEELARHHREHAQKTESSARLLLAHLHEAYNISGGKRTFVNEFRLWPVEVLQKAAKQFGRQAHRDNIKDRKAYFAAIVRSVHEAYRQRKALEYQLNEERQKREDEMAVSNQVFEDWARQPTKGLEAALHAMTAQWLPKTQKLLAEGAGAPRAWMRQALQSLAELHSPTRALDIAQGVFHNFELCLLQQSNDGPIIVQAVRKVFDQVCQEEFKTTEGGHCVPENIFATLIGTDQRHTHSPPKTLWN